MGCNIFFTDDKDVSIIGNPTEKPFSVEGGEGDDGCAGDKTSCGDNSIAAKIDSGGDATYSDVGIVGDNVGSRGEDNSAIEVADG